jgi:hypothetical protein
MQMLDTRKPWSRHFLAAMELAALASARLPFGVPDPVIGGAAAVALYTGGLWPVTALEMTTVDEAKLVAELFAVGFRWARGARSVDLWHPDCEIGIDIRPASAPRAPADQANQLTVALDLEWQGRSHATTLQVVGIENLIAEQVQGWLLDGAPRGEHVTRIQALVALAWAGVGGPLRAGYLQRRLAWETKGEVSIDDLSFGSEGRWAGTPRCMGLTDMQSRIQAWRAREGLVADPPDALSTGNSDIALAARIGGRDGELAEGWRSGVTSATVLPFRIPHGMPPAQR